MPERVHSPRVSVEGIDIETLSLSVGVRWRGGTCSEKEMQPPLCYSDLSPLEQIEYKDSIHRYDYQ